ncbi:MAG: iron-sulfur cluster assembly scaffold protein [Alphaproteobacteria bacterium]|uniref:iron-sulfur cluster assembly scaffold protein n=1 Tax=Candidatus Levibacter sp. Uisw_134_01 TaxID=3230999 RepID=UPI0023332A1A|nr:iron-sulfur cluster assembly scaffold protein [Alphaproteobacteria bacterium]MDG1882284.1 iron-sulfur cluster assembly scaffold protein [Alphaproteobacteria bacterium]MDG2458400.1 iron-sulfur cluster assembly scaffold protein [Alphaproteobacteria bacterium]
MNTLSIYQEKILKLAAENKKSFAIDHYNCSFNMKNPMCGDEVQVRVDLINKKINNISAIVRGCALCEASAGLVVQLFKNNSVPHNDFMKEFLFWLNNNGQEINSSLPKELEIFLPIKEISNRHTCITMPFEATIKSLKSTNKEN